MLACGTDTAGKHQIELLWFANLVVSVRVANVVLVSFAYEGANLMGEYGSVLMAALKTRCK
jgi:hypothetical protein